MRKLVLIALALLAPACNWIGYPVYDYSTGRWWNRIVHESDGAERGRCLFKANAPYGEYTGCVVRRSALVDGCVWDYDEVAWCQSQPNVLYGQVVSLQAVVVDY